MHIETARPALDLRGKMITTFIAYEVASALESIDVGGRIEFVTDEHPAIEHDLRTWAEANKHRIIDEQMTSKGRRFVIEKGAGPDKIRSMAVVISTAGLEELLSPLGFALAAALEGVDVHVYFQGPGVRVLQRGYRPSLTGWWRRPFSRLAASGMADAGHVAAQEKVRQLVSLGAHIYVCAPSLDRFGVAPADLIFDDIPQIEYLSFMAIMRDADIQLYP